MKPRTFSKIIESGSYELRKFKDEHGEGYEVFCPSELDDQPLGMVPAGGNVMQDAMDMIREFRRNSPGMPKPTKDNIRLVENGDVEPNWMYCDVSCDGEPVTDQQTVIEAAKQLGVGPEVEDQEGSMGLWMIAFSEEQVRASEVDGYYEGQATVGGKTITITAEWP